MSVLHALLGHIIYIYTCTTLCNEGNPFFLYTSNTASVICTCTFMYMDTYYIVCICTCVTAYHLQGKCVYMLCVLRLNWPSIFLHGVAGNGPTLSKECCTRSSRQHIHNASVAQHCMASKCLFQVPDNC